MANTFSITLSPSSRAIQPGGSVSYTVTTALLTGVAETIALTFTGTLPAGFSASFSPTTVLAGGTSTLTTTAPPSYPVNVVSSFGNNVQVLGYAATFNVFSNTVNLLISLLLSSVVKDSALAVDSSLATLTAAAFYVTYLEILGAAWMRVHFSRGATNNNDLLTPGNYSILPGIVPSAVAAYVKTVVPEAVTNPTYVDLYLRRKLSKQGRYSVGVANVVDLSGQSMSAHP